MFVVAVVAPMCTMVRQTGLWATAPNATLVVVVVIIVMVAVAFPPGHPQWTYSPPTQTSSKRDGWLGEYSPAAEAHAESMLYMSGPCPLATH